MSDSEGSIVSSNGSEKSVTHDETTEMMLIRQNGGEKPEEFEKLLQSMIVTHSVSEEEEQVGEEDNANEKKIVGRFIDCTTIQKFVIMMSENVLKSASFYSNQSRFF